MSLARNLRVAAAVLGIATVPVALWLPVYSSGESVADNVGGLFWAVLAVAVGLACLPAVVGGCHSRAVSLACGVLLLLGSFVTAFGLFLIPAAALLLLSLRWNGPVEGGVTRAGRLT